MFFHLLFGVVWFHNRVHLGPAILCCTTYIPGMYLCVQSAAAAAAAAAAAVVAVVVVVVVGGVVVVVAVMVVVVLLLLLLAAAVRHRVPDGVIFCLFIASDSCVFFPFHSIRFIFTAPLGSIVAFMSSIGLYYVLGNYGQWRSQGRRQSAPAKPHL